MPRSRWFENLFPVLEELNIGYVAFSPLANGILAEEKQATPAQISLAWMINKKPYIVPIPGSRKIERIRENGGRLILY